MLFAASGYCKAKVKDTTGFGLIIGSPTGINLKHFTSPKNTAFDGDFSVAAGKIYLTASYLWHDYKALPPVEEGKLPIFFGPSLAVHGDKPAAGGTFGVAYIFDEYPFDIVIKLSPVVVFGKDTTATFIGGIGARYFFR